eukprot:11968465-Alexandrium_andersonii.AAC.1
MDGTARGNWPQRAQPATVFLPLSRRRMRKSRSMRIQDEHLQANTTAAGGALRPSPPGGRW